MIRLWFELSLSGQQVTWPMQSSITKIQLGWITPEANHTSQTLKIIHLSYPQQFSAILRNPPQIFPWQPNLFFMGLSKVTFCTKIQLWQPACSLVCQENKGYELIQLVCLSPTKESCWTGWLLVPSSGGIKQELTVSFSIVSWKCRKLPQGIEATAICREQKAVCVHHVSYGWQDGRFSFPSRATS